MSELLDAALIVTVALDTLHAPATTEPLVVVIGDTTHIEVEVNAALRLNVQEVAEDIVHDPAKFSRCVLIDAALG